MKGVKIVMSSIIEIYECTRCGQLSYVKPVEGKTIEDFVEDIGKGEFVFKLVMCVTCREDLAW